ncbi:MAG TPA: zf-HC2 domain-containing protein [Terriglobales bacterium]|jgi:predicted anti-sigma-YlaC factor YlaD|nr:zf-HC2 domain-containing protein [Terriglobales bacterium]
MTRNAHDEARELIALGDGLSPVQQAWLRSHLDECEACRDYGEAAKEMVRALRSLPLAADSRLVRATQMRVRFHADRLREARQRMWLVGMACLGVGLSATLTVPLLWGLFARLGQWAGVSTLVWQAGFIFFSIAPALVVSVLLLARGIHWTDDHERPRQGRQES